MVEDKLTSPSPGKRLQVGHLRLLQFFVVSETSFLLSLICHPQKAAPWSKVAAVTPAFQPGGGGGSTHPSTRTGLFLGAHTLLLCLSGHMTSPNCQGAWEIESCSAHSEGRLTELW